MTIELPVNLDPTAISRAARSLKNGFLTDPAFAPVADWLLQIAGQIGQQKASPDDLQQWLQEHFLRLQNEGQIRWKARVSAQRTGSTTIRSSAAYLHLEWGYLNFERTLVVDPQGNVKTTITVTLGEIKLVSKPCEEYGWCWEEK